MYRFDGMNIKHVYVTLDPRGTASDGTTRQTHPFVVYAVDVHGAETQHQNNRSLRDCLICGNGMIAAFMACGARIVDHNVVFDTRFDKNHI